MPNHKALTRKEHFSLQDLQEIVTILRAPDGCPWDRVQTHESIRNHFAEEVFEAIEGIDRRDNAILCEELGDVLLHVVFHASLAKEEGAFGMQEVLDGICQKMIRRHPHVFSSRPFSPDDWARIKAEEKQEAGLGDRLAHISTAFPAPMRAQKILEKGKEQTKPGVIDPAGDPVLEAGARLYALCDECRAQGIDAEEALDRYLNKIIENCTNN